MASRCNTALVEPPRAMVTVIAFSKALRVMICRGRIPRRTRSTTAAPARVLSACFSLDMAFCAELFGRLMPSASIAEAMVFAVYIPAHEPGPGIAVRSTNLSCCRETLPRA